MMFSDNEFIHLVAMALVNGISCAAGIIGNTIVLVVFLKNQDYLHGMNLFIVAIAIADLVVCSLVQPVFIYGLFASFDNSSAFKVFESSVFAVLIQISMNLLLCVAINRLVELSCTFSYHSLATTMRVTAMILVVCILSAVQGVLFNVNQAMQNAEPYFQYATIAAFLLIYVRIFLIAKKHRNAITIQTNSLSFNHGLTVSRITHLRASTVTTGMITGAFVVCFLPFSIVNLMDNEDSDIDNVHEVLKFWVSTVVSCNSSMNAYIYTLRSENFKSAVKKVIRSTRFWKRW